MRTKEERLTFLKVYSELHQWLLAAGFENGEGGTSSDYHYSHYNEHIDPLYSVESYVHHTFKLHITFLSDRNEHKIMIVDKGAVSSPISISEFKRNLSQDLKNKREKMISHLASLCLDY